MVARTIERTEKACKADERDGGGENGVWLKEKTVVPVDEAGKVEIRPKQFGTVGLHACPVS